MGASASVNRIIWAVARIFDSGVRYDTDDMDDIDGRGRLLCRLYVLVNNYRT